MAEQTASRTAVMVCQGRAVADGRFAPGRFADPVAMPLLRPDEQELVQQVRSESPPKDMGGRMAYEMVKASAMIIVPRTVAIDDAIIAHRAPQVVILGAGLDARAWRMDALAGVPVCEVDRPASQRDKQDRAKGLPADRAPHYVPVDFGEDDLGEALEAAGHDAGKPTTWVWEGVVPYLTRDEVALTVGQVAERSAAGSRLIVNYQAPSVSGVITRRVVGGVLAAVRRSNPWATEPWRSAWSASGMSQLLARHGFVVRDDHDLLATAVTLDAPLGPRPSQRNGRVVIAERA
jgi:methyltransferase (TIGR00027 family)